jgi:hypothetical protein
MDDLHILSELLNQQPEEAKNRLRFLASYAKDATSWHGWRLHRWENDLRSSLNNVSPI